MSDVSWDDDDFEPVKAAPVLPSDKWDGEDEEDVKCSETWDNWDDEDEEKPASTTTTTTTTTGTTATTTTAQAKKKKKKIGDIIAEKEAKQQEEVERRRREAEERAAGQTAAGRLAEKLRLQKVQEDADLQLASELVGGEDDSRLLEGVDLNATEGLSLLRRALVAKVRATDRLEKRPAYVTFVEDLARDLCQNLELDEVKRVTAVLNTLYNEKMRASKPKSKKKQTGKAKLNVGSGAIADDYTNDFGAEYDDFI